MNSIHASDQFLQVIWPDFTAHFRNEVSIASYEVDVAEFMRFCESDFLQLDYEKAEAYFEYLQKKLETGKMQPSTMAKKIRELHSLAEYICDERGKYKVPASFRDYFLPYLKRIAKIDKYAKTIPVEHIDKIFTEAQDDLQAYCIFALLQRVGLSSTEIVGLKLCDIVAYDNGVYAELPSRKDSCFIPEDVFVILGQYIAQRQEQEYLFYNSRRNKLNTMYISRLMKKYTELAGVPNYSAEALRNTCAVTMFAYEASPEQVARQMGVTQIQIKRYKNLSYRDNLVRAANELVKVRVEPPK